MRSRRPTLEEILRIIRAEAEAYSALFIIVDGLDELVPEDLRNTFVHHLEHLATTFPSIQVFIATRPIPLIQSVCPGAQEIPVVALTEDILLHVRRRIDTDRQMIRSFVMGDAAKKEKIARKVAEKAAGVCVALYVSVRFKIIWLCRFLMANLHVDSLSFKMNKTTFQQAFEVLPSTSDVFYIEALERISAQDETFSKIAFLALSWISCSKRPMKMIELRYALAMSVKTDEMPLCEDDLPSEATILSSCAGLIKLNEETEEVTLIRE